MADPHVADVGTVFEVTIVDQDDAVVDISQATTKEILFQKPDRTRIARPAVLTTDGTDGKMQYACVADDIDKAGSWQYEGFVVIPNSGEFYSEVAHFTVDRNLR